jgi:tyrosine-protein kinase Etk/Wzc
MTASDSRAPTEPDDDINLLDLAAAIWAGKYLVLAAMLVCGLIGAVLVLRATPLYQAKGLIQLETDANALALPQGMQDLLGTGSSGHVTTETQIAILRSRMVISAAVGKLDLQTYATPEPFPLLGPIPARLHLPDPGIAALAPYQWGDEAIAVGALRLPAGWTGRDMVLTITAPGRYEIVLPDGSRARGAAGTELSLADKGFALMVTRLDGPVGRRFHLGRRPLEAAVARVQAGFAVDQAGRVASVLQTSYSDSSPQRAEQVLNAIAQAYVEQNIQRSAASAQNSLDFIRKQLPDAEVAVTKAQDALNAYQQQHQSIDITYQTQTLLERVTGIEAQLSALALKEEELKNLYTANHPTYQALLQDRATLQSQLADAKKAVNQLPETQKEIFNLQRDLEVAQQIYVQLLNREQELRVVRASTVGSVRVIDTAYASAAPVAPRKARILGIALLIGLALGAGAVLLRRALRRGIRGAQEIEQIGLPVFATIPYAPDAANLRKRKGLLPVLALSRPDDIAVEALRSLRTSLHFGMLDAATRTVLLTSAAPAAGKSFTAVNLAIVAAQAGQKVCLVDADLRRGYIRRFLGRAKETPGLTEYLAKEKPLDDVLIDGPVDGLSVILTGRYPPNPSELLMRAEFEQLLVELDRRFDLVLVDAAPALAVTDPVVIGRYTGARIVVVRHMETMLPEIEAVRRAFETAGSKLTGAILNGYKLSEDAKYGYAYKYYNYRYSYKSGK